MIKDKHNRRRRRPFLTLLLILGGLYFGLHLALGSSPVQRRVLAELQKALAEFGIDLKIESIEFSAFSPKIYLNRVTLTTTSKAPLRLEEPLNIDKIKIQFQPFALISRRIVMDEVTLFHPRIIVPRADQLYRKIEQMLQKKEKVNLASPKFTVVLKKVGMVDTLLNVASQDPPFAVRSRSVSVFLENNTNQQQTLTADSQQIEIERGPLQLNLSRLELDIDLTAKSLRVNRAILRSESQQLNVNIIGAAALPAKEAKTPDSFNASYDFKLPLALMNKIPELDVTAVAGVAISSGTVQYARGNFSGNGTLKYENIGVDGYKLGSGSMAFDLSEKNANFHDLVLKYANGEIRSQSLTIGLQDRFPISGELQTREVRLESILDSVKSYNNLIRLPLSGTIAAEGFLTGPFAITAQVKQTTPELLVLKNAKKESGESNTVIRVPDARAEGTLTFNLDRMGFKAEVSGLGGVVQGEGFVGFDSSAEVTAKSTSPISLTELKRIANLRLGGDANVTFDLRLPREDELKISSTIDVIKGEINTLNVGALRGQIVYQNLLLSFENLETMGGEPARGSGFVDFRPADVHYKFSFDARRLSVDRVFDIFSKRKLSFTPPQGGEVVGAKMTIEGGHLPGDILEVNSTGQAKGFSFYGERWQGADFSISYKDDLLELNRVMLFKKTGGLEVRGSFNKDTKISFISHGLRLEELDAIGRAPLVGEISGAVTLTEDLRVLPPRGTGELRLSKLAFRGNPIPDVAVKIQPEGENVELLVTAAGERLRGRYVRPLGQVDRGTVLLYFKEFDFAPLLSFVLGKDIPTLTEIAGTGDLSFTGNLNDWKTVKGSGSVTLLRLGLKGTPMINKSPLEIQIAEGAVKVERFHLVGTDSQLSLDYLYRPNQAVQASLDGKVDLQYLQPFIPGLDYGSGKVSVGLRLSGHPSRFELLGNATLEEGTFRLSGLNDELRSVQTQIGISQDKLSIDRFEATVGGGKLTIAGEVKIDRFKLLAPDLRLQTDRITMRFQNALSTTLTGTFHLKGAKMPYLLSGQCRVDQAALTKFDTAPPRVTEDSPSLAFDIQCEAKDKLMVATEVMNSEFRGNFHLLGNTQRMGLIGNADAMNGSLLFRETKFTLNTGTVKFEAADSIAPRFNVSGRAVVRETRALVPQDYEITLQVFGTPADYKIRLSSTPALAESEITSLLLLGVTSRTAEGNSGGNVVDLGTAIAGQIPLQSKLQSELGVDIKINAQTVKDTSASSTDPAGVNQLSTVPSVQIQKEIMKKTRLYYSNTLDTAIPIREFKIEQSLFDDNVTMNVTAGDKARTETQTQTSKSYGFDVRYRFSFE